MKQLTRKFQQISILILAITFVSCEEDEAVLPQVIAGFTYTLNADTGTVTFINISDNSKSYDWDFGDGSTSKEINPIKTYANGTYTITLKASNAAGASATFEDEVTISIPNPIGIPVTFDDPNVAYDVAIFGGASFEIVDNPDVSGTNDKASKVGAITNSGAAYEGINFDLGTQIDFTTDKTITMNFWADAEVDVLLKLEQGTGPDIEITASHGGTGWEMISFNFNSSDKYVRVTIFVDGPGTKVGTFYIDDIEQIETPAPTGPTDAPTAPPTRDAADVISIYGEAYGAEVGLANVDWDNGSNFAEETIASNKLLKVDFVDFLGTQLNTVVDATEMTNFHMDLWIVDDFAAGQIFNPKWSNHTGGAGETNAFEYTNPVGDSDAKKWISIDIPITDFTGDNTRADLTQLLLAVGGTLDVVYVDNVYFYKTGGGGTACTETMLFLPIDFDCEGIDYESKRVPGDISFSIIDNPQQNGANPVATKVGEIVNIGNNWENLNFTLDTPIDFTTDKSIKLKLYSTVSVDIKLKVEGGGTPVENDQTHGGTGWEELTFTLATSESFSNIIVFIDGPGNTVGTFYIDDIEQVSSGGGGSSGNYDLSLPIDFESAGFGAAWAWNVFENDSNPPVEFVANPDASGINTSSTVAKITALQAGQPWVGCETAHGEMGITWDLSASNAFIKIMVYKTVISDVGIKLVNPAGGAQGEIKVANTKINEWEELTFDFSGRIGNGLDGSTNIDQIAVFPDFDTVGRTADNVVYFDNIRFSNN